VLRPTLLEIDEAVETLLDCLGTKVLRIDWKGECAEGIVGGCAFEGLSHDAPVPLGKTVVRYSRVTAQVQPRPASKGEDEVMWAIDDALGVREGHRRYITEWNPEDVAHSSGGLLDVRGLHVLRPGSLAEKLESSDIFQVTVAETQENEAARSWLRHCCPPFKEYAPAPLRLVRIYNAQRSKCGSAHLEHTRYILRRGRTWRRICPLSGTPSALGRNPRPRPRGPMQKTRRVR